MLPRMIKNPDAGHTCSDMSSTNKASLPDGLSARVLKESSSEIAPILALIYNESLDQSTVSDDW